jgi:hypothetical protein
MSLNDGIMGGRRGDMGVLVGTIDRRTWRRYAGWFLGFRVRDTEGASKRATATGASTYDRTQWCLLCFTTPKLHAPVVK